MNEKLSINSGELSRTEKIDFLSEMMYKRQPDFPDFRGYRKEGFSGNRLNKAKMRLNKKLDKITMREYETGRTSDDEFAKGAEPLITYVLNEGRLFPSRKCASYLASEYDDKMNGTDIVLHASKKGSDELMTFSIDVATGTNLKNIQGKFKESGQAHNQGETPPWTANAEYCKLGDDRWSVFGAPHFVVGLQPSGVNWALDNIRIEPGENLAREDDMGTDLMILSELYEQIKMQLSLPSNRKTDEETKKRRSDLRDFGSAVLTGLYKVLKMDQFPKKTQREVFDRIYPNTIEKLKRSDETYKHIIDEAQKLQHRFRGEEAVRASVKKSAG